MRKAAWVAAGLMMIMMGTAFGSGRADYDLLDAGGISSVTVRARFLDVDLLGSDTGRVSISFGDPDRGFNSTRGVRLRREQFGSHLDVWVETDWPFGATGGGTLQVRLPHDVHVRVETVSGRISASELSGSTCDLKTVSGGIRLRGVTGGIVARTVSGAIVGDDVAFVSDSSFSSVSGRVEIRSLSPLESLRFDLSSISGRIVVGGIASARGLRMGLAGPLVQAHTVSGCLSFK